VCIFLLQDHREAGEFRKWELLVEKLSPLRNGNPDLFSDDFYYQEIYFNVWTLKHAEAADQLANWQPQKGNFLALIRKAGLLAEMDEPGESESILSETLTEIREHLVNEGRNIHLLSLEGWCLLLLHRVELSIPTKRSWTLPPQLRKRFRQLRSFDCDPQEHLNAMQLSLEQQPPDIGAHIQDYDFDSGTVTQRNIYRSETFSDRLPALNYIRLFEFIGFPLKLRLVETSSALPAACKWLEPFGYFLSAFLLTRAGKFKIFEKKSFFQRYEVLGLDPEKIDHLITWAHQTLKAELQVRQAPEPQTSNYEEVWRTLIELISRLTVRMSDEQLLASFQLALQCLCHPVVYSIENLYKVNYRWLDRINVVATPFQVSEWIPEIILSPLLHGKQSHWLKKVSHANDAFGSFEDQELTLNSENWDLDEICRFLSENAKSSDPFTRAGAIERFCWLYRGKYLSQKNTEILIGLLWTSSETDEWILNDSFPMVNYLHLPHPPVADTREVVKNRVLEGDPTHSCEVAPNQKLQKKRLVGQDQWIRELSLASKGHELPHEFGGTIEWKTEEILELSEKILKWWEHDKATFNMRGHGVFSELTVDPTKKTTRDAARFLGKTVLTSRKVALRDLRHAVIRFFEEAYSAGAPVLPFWIYGLSLEESRNTKIAELVEERLRSSEKSFVDEAAKALFHWTALASEKIVSEPPKLLVNLLVERIVFRKKPGLQHVIYQTASIQMHTDLRFDDDTLSDLLKGIDNIWKLVQISNESGKDYEFLAEEKPGYLVRCTIIIAVLHLRYADSIPKGRTKELLDKLWGECQALDFPEIRKSIAIWSEDRRQRN